MSVDARAMAEEGFVRLEFFKIFFLKGTVTRDFLTLIVIQFHVAPLLNYNTTTILSIYHCKLSIYHCIHTTHIIVHLQGDPIYLRKNKVSYSIYRLINFYLAWKSKNKIKSRAFSMTALSQS